MRTGPTCRWRPTLALDCRYDVVLAHPERFCFSRGNRRQLARLAALPVGLQVNADSLLRRPLRGLALELLRSAAIPLLGSDCHDLARRPPRLEAARTVIRRRLGPDFLARMDRQADRLTRPRPGEAAL